MGALWRWDFPPQFIKRFPLFVETGVGFADGIVYARECGWKRLISIEVDPAHAKRAAIKTLNYPAIKIITGDSGEFLRYVDCVGTFFWLDAHCPGHGYGTARDPLFERDPDVRMPLQREMELLRGYAGHCAILIDDLRYYSDAMDWHDGPLPDDQNTLPPEVRNLDFLEPFKERCAVEIFPEDAGYALIVPHGCPRPTILR